MKATENVVRFNDAKSGSVIMLTYYDAGGSVPLVVTSQSNACFYVSGTKYTSFKYVIVNP